MKHTGDYELEKINMLEQECADLEEENKRLEEENKKLKSDLSECECSMLFENDEVWYRKRECKKLKEDNKRLREWVDAGQKLVEDLISKNKKLKAELDKYKKQYEHSMWFSDFWWYDEDAIK